MNHDDRFELADDVHARRFDTELVILDLAGGNYFGLNEVGAAYWDCMIDGRTVGEAIAAIAQRYKVEESVIVRDLTDLIGEMLRRGLVRRKNL